MPLYEYQCDGCGQVFELLQRFSDPAPDAHDGCGGAVKRLLSPSAFQFKGSGWYVTDYGKSGNGKKTESAGADTKKESKNVD